MNTQKLDEIDALILEEKKSIAQEHFNEAWDAAIADGIDPELMAQTLVQQSLRQVATLSGDHEANKIISKIRSMESEGEFLLDKTIQ